MQAPLGAWRELPSRLCNQRMNSSVEDRCDDLANAQRDVVQAGHSPILRLSM